jgi:predicted nucleic acid-binding protein
MRLVLDASTALAAVLPDEDSTFARAAAAAALRDGLVVPTLWLYEIQNGLATALRRQRIDSTSAHAALEALQGLAPDIEAPQGLGRELRLAQSHALTAYDAAYLAVALNTGAILASNDSALRHAAERAGIRLFAPAATLSGGR